MRRRGDGTYVRDWNVRKLPHQYSLRGTYHDLKDYVVSKIIKFEVIHPTPQIAEKLCISQDAFVYEITRKRVFEGRPLIMEYTYMPVDIIPGLKKEHLEKSIYGYIQDGLGYKIHSAFVKINGVRPNLLEQEEMGLSTTDFLMEAERVVSLDNCQVFEYSIAHHVPEFFDFETVIFEQ